MEKSTTRISVRGATGNWRFTFNYPPDWEIDINAPEGSIFLSLGLLLPSLKDALAPQVMKDADLWNDMQAFAPMYSSRKLEEYSGTYLSIKRVREA